MVFIAHNFFRALLFFALCILNLSCWSDKMTKQEDNSQMFERKKITAADLKADRNGLSHARVIIKTGHGNVIFKFYPKEAPETVTRIIELIQQSFYDGLKFHRVVPGFVVQGGDPTGTGTGGSGHKLKAEFSNLQHIKGTVAMARAQNPDSADSQFYIALTTLPHLDKKYTIFGQVVKGLEILDKISQGDKIISMFLEV